MPTTVHLPADLLQQVDRRAAARGISRNRYIRKALEDALHHETDWSPRFAAILREAGSDPERGQVVNEMMRAIRSGRRSRKRPPAL